MSGLFQLNEFKIENSPGGYSDVNDMLVDHEHLPIECNLCGWFDMWETSHIICDILGQIIYMIQMIN